jgi:hypothetical protein
MTQWYQTEYDETARGIWTNMEPSGVGVVVRGRRGMIYNEHRHRQTDRHDALCVSRIDLILEYRVPPSSHIQPVTSKHKEGPVNENTDINAMWLFSEKGLVWGMLSMRQKWFIIWNIHQAVGLRVSYCMRYVFVCKFSLSCFRSWFIGQKMKL